MSKMSVIIAVALYVGSFASAIADERYFDTQENLREASKRSLTILDRYPRPNVIGGIDPNIPASALSPIPVNVLHSKHNYSVGEASVGSRPLKGRAERRRSTAW